MSRPQSGRARAATRGVPPLRNALPAPCFGPRSSDSAIHGPERRPACLDSVALLPPAAEGLDLSIRFCSPAVPSLLCDLIGTDPTCPLNAACGRAELPPPKRRSSVARAASPDCPERCLEQRPSGSRRERSAGAPGRTNRHSPLQSVSAMLPLPCSSHFSRTALERCSGPRPAGLDNIPDRINILFAQCSFARTA